MQIDKIIVECTSEEQEVYINQLITDQWGSIEYHFRELPKLLPVARETHMGPSNTSNWGN